MRCASSRVLGLWWDVFLCVSVWNNSALNIEMTSYLKDLMKQYFTELQKTIHDYYPPRNVFLNASNDITSTLSMKNPSYLSSTVRNRSGTRVIIPTANKVVI